MADQTDLMDAAVDSAVAAFDVFVAGEAEDGSFPADVRLPDPRVGDGRVA